MNFSYSLLLFIACMAAISDYAVSLQMADQNVRKSLKALQRADKNQDVYNAAGFRKQVEASRSKRSVAGPLWPITTIPFAFNSLDKPKEFSKSDRNKIRDALKEIEQSVALNNVNCLTFVEHTNQVDYIFFVNNGECNTNIGFTSGANNISLSSKCRSKGQIIQQVMLKLGFDFEHTRPDRDSHVKVVKDQLLQKKFAHSNSNKESVSDTPYDFYSVMHYDWTTNENNDPTMLSKFPALVTDKNAMKSSRDQLSPIDIYKLQKLYQCDTVDTSESMAWRSGEEESIEDSRVENITKRFMMETKLNDVSVALAEKYLETSFKLCGAEHFWPVHYPMVESGHPLYKLVCVKKREWYGKCRFSIECDDREAAFCVRPFYKRRGYCSKLGGKFGQIANDWLLEIGQKIKDGFTINKQD